MSNLKMRWMAALLLGFCLTHCYADTNRPNIIVILADDMGFSDLGCYGSEIPTPNLDKMAADGLRFTQFYNTPRCCPSRAALMTGLYPQEAGIGDMMEKRDLPGYQGELNDRCVTLAEVLRSAGYHTAMVGKWHMSHIYFDGKKQLNFRSDIPFWDNKSSWPVQRGFEEYYGEIHGVTSYFDPFSLVTNNTPINAEGPNFYLTDSLADHAVGYIDQLADSGKPFFLYAAFTAPHWPLQAPEADIAKNRKTYMAGWDIIRTNRYKKEIELGVIDKDWPLSPRDPNVRDWASEPNKEWEANRMATYAAMIEHLDQGVGKIMAELKSKNIDTNTLVIFMSDNGACNEDLSPSWYDVPSKTRDGRPIKAGNHDPSVFSGPVDVWQSYCTPWANVSDTPFRLYKHFTHEGGISTPFIVHWPATIQQTGGLTSQIGHITDIMPTVVEVANAKYPTEFNSHAIQPMEGESLLPVFEAKERQDRVPIYWEHEGNRAVRFGKWKLVAFNRGAWELYDMDVDRTEQHNLAASNPDKVRELSDLYRQWAQRCGVVPRNQLSRPEKTTPAASSE